MTKGEEFVHLFKYWCGRLGLDENIPIHKDNRFDCHAAVVDYNNEKIRLIYNTKKLAKWSEALLMCGVLHEIGHLVNNLPYETEKEQIYSEYRAEKYSLNLMKINYPKLYKEAIKEFKYKLKKPSWMKKNPIHYKAFIKIKEYQ